MIFEGLDGSGKTTLIQKVRKKGHELITLQGLGSSSIDQPLRDIFLTNSQLKPLTRYILSFANLVQIQEEIIKIYLNTNKIILIDRWLGYNFAYQTYPHNIDKNYQFFNLLNKQFIKPALLRFFRQILSLKLFFKT
ncbi:MULTISPECIES: dTMP kinase [16SrI (Aster yellows group)]|uniref:dTMP kinase n=1 Tax=16SrI (Aster yellows group) TaxID=3042590 RepID=UPI0028060440|nr:MULTISPECIES: dTMP kinase [16SrI (Aster yellows group)]